MTFPVYVYFDGRHPFIYYYLYIKEPLFYQYIVGFIRFILILKITNKFLSTYILLKQISHFKSKVVTYILFCDFYIYTENITGVSHNDCEGNLTVAMKQEDHDDPISLT